jgi:glyoxylase-like metal-dependent hydrolase (beta-lactamase superfamily II)/8-oxo-dGTP pyrophosphatase MutT (NUDIX family)
MMETLRQAAAVLLSRDSQVWLGQRGDTRFLPGFWVFPGGGNDPGESPEAAARRELEEETGLLLEAPLVPFARAITPAYAPVRYDCRVFRAQVPDGAELVVDDRELVRGRWFEIDDLLALRDRGELQMAPPTYRQLVVFRDALAGRRPFPHEEEAFSKPPFADQQILPMADGLTVVPLRSPAMPPAAWTNALIVGRQRLFVIDPGGQDPRVLVDELGRRQAAGAEVAGVILTHHHPDHLAGYLALGLTDRPLYCHPITAPLLPEGFPSPRPWNDGETIAVEPGLSMLAHWTPGHAPGHLAVQIPERKALLAADLISSLSSIVIPSSNGDLVQYLDSLARMRALDCHLVIPSHGPPYGQGSDPFGLAIAHRQHREEQVLRCLHNQQAPVSLDDLTQTLYRGLDERLFPAARANVWHHLRKLQDEDRCRESDEGWICVQ